jgi:ABC-type lipoprotein export system ATPase subunit
MGKTAFGHCKASAFLFRMSSLLPSSALRAAARRHCLNLIGGLDSITSGDILFNYRSLKAMDSKAMDSYRNNRIGFIFQDYFMISTFSILENVMLALTVQGVKDKEAKEKALKALQEVGLGGMEKKKPRQLSGGQQQRAAIARGLVLDPSIILGR